VICALSLAIVVAVLVTGPLAGFVVRRRGATPQAKPSAAPAVAAAAPTAAAPVARQRPELTTVPKIVRLKEDSTRLLAAPPSAETMEVPVPTTALRIQRRPSPPADADATQHLPAPTEEKRD
jgi:hypothetical protein